MPDVEDADDLYRLPPQEFTAARDALARRLRAAKERERADEVKRLRRPSALAWALNQVARSDGALLDAVLAAGDELRDAFGRGDGRGIRDAEREMRQASEAVVDAAATALAEGGNAVTDDARSRLATTLRAALMDADVAARLRSGTLERDVEAAGLGLEDMAVVGPATAPRAPSRPRGEARERERKDPEQQKAEREERRRREEARKAARVRVAELEATAERLATRAERLAGVADRAEEAARQARIEAGEAQTEAEEAAERAASARAEQEQL